jgi:hypothetical protein
VVSVLDVQNPLTASLRKEISIGDRGRYIESAYRAAESARLDFTREDRVPDAILNDILWHSVKGANAPEPRPRHAQQLPAEDRGSDG